MTKKKEKDGAAKHKEQPVLLPWTYTTIIGVLMFVVSSGGYFAGYYVSNSPPQAHPSVLIGSGFDDVLHIVTRVIDGDTFVVDSTHTVRMLGVSAPELDQCYGGEAQMRLSQLLLGNKVILQKDSDARDDVGRLLRYVFVHNSDGEKDNVFVNKLLIQEGFAISDHRGANRKYESLLNNTMGVSRNAKRGMHQVCEPLRDAVLPAPTDSCVIKGNVNDEQERKYYLPQCSNYDRIKMRGLEGDAYFCTEKEAQEAGFEKSGNCRG